MLVTVVKRHRVEGGMEFHKAKSCWRPALFEWLASFGVDRGSSA